MGVSPVVQHSRLQQTSGLSATLPGGRTISRDVSTMTARGDDIRRVVEFPVHSFTFVTPRWRP